MAPPAADDDKPTTRIAPQARRPRDAYGDPDAATRRVPASGAGSDEATSYIGRKRSDKADTASDADKEHPPVVGWLVVVDGPGKGKALSLYEGRNLVGRGEECEARLDFGDAGVSRAYSFVVRYTASTRRFKIAPNIAVKNAAKLNGEEFDDPVDLRGGDHIVVGVTKLRFVPFCGEAFDWADLDSPAAG